MAALGWPFQEGWMQYAVAIILVAGAVGWALFGGAPIQQVATASDIPRQLSQLSR